MSPGDRVIVFSQNCPQFIAAYFAILRADAVFVPVNAMLLRDELQHIIEDSGATVAFVASELLDRVTPLVGTTPGRCAAVPFAGPAEQRQLGHLLGRHHRADAALGPRGRGRAHRAASRHLLGRAAAMLVDFFAQPGIEQRDLSSLTVVTGGGAATPQHVNDILKSRYGLDYVEGCGLTESANFLCANPLYKPKKGYLGIATFGVDLRTGDLASMDEEGYVFMHDRLKRMINASGFKVWPAEVEAALHAHPSILEACVIATPDERRGETVKAVVTLRRGSTDDSASLLAWCRDHMATYKAPRIVQIVDALPRNATGKIAWRELQEQEAAPVH